ncbi:hypothetical protein [Metabacillus litoralis]|uniref:hypothetical protein n=1 Tax=Metabacillus litoralis TaxID=152268 RepID=UPI00203ACD10|nr:hypothetical protein [Metabacillus litoralis]MCM3163723.1 hypothetical protein [Metabacillus litoralis]
MDRRNISAQFDDLASFMVKTWNHAIEKDIRGHFKKEVLKDIFFIDEYQTGADTKETSLPYSFFAYLCSNHYQNTKLQQDFFQLIRTFMNVFDTHLLNVNGEASRYQTIDFIHALRKHPRISQGFRQELLVRKIKDCYYQRRQYRKTLKMIHVLLPQINSASDRNEVLYIKALSHYHLQGFHSFQTAVEECKSHLKDGADLVKLGRLSFLAGNINESYEYYFRSSQQRENLQAALCGNYALTLISSATELKKTKEKSYYLPMQVESEIDQFIVNYEMEQFVIRPKDKIKQLNQSIHSNTFKHQQNVIRRERTKSFGMDNYMYEAYRSLMELLYFTEKWGIPDIAISRSESVSNFLTQSLSEGNYPIVDCTLGFGIEVDLSVINDPSLSFKSFIEGVMKKLMKSSAFIEENRGKYFSLWIPILSLDVQLQYVKTGIELLNNEEATRLSHIAFQLIKLRIPSINNKIMSTCHDVIVKLINMVSVEESIALFESYLTYIADHPGDMYHRIGFVSFRWKKEEFNLINEHVLVDLATSIKNSHVDHADALYQIYSILHDHYHISDEVKSLLIEVFSEIDANNQRKNSPFFKQMLIKFQGSQPETVYDLQALLASYLEDKSNSTLLGKPLYVIKDTLELLQPEDLAKLIWKTREDLNRVASTKKTHKFLDQTIAELYKEALLHFYLETAISRQNIVYVKWLFHFLPDSLHYLNGTELEQIRNVFQSQSAELSNHLQTQIKESFGNKRIKIAYFARNWLTLANEWDENDKGLFQLLKNQVYDSNPEMIQFGITVISDLQLWSKYLEEEHPLSVPIVQKELILLYNKIKKWPQEELNPSFITQFDDFIEEHKSLLGIGTK